MPGSWSRSTILSRYAPIPLAKAPRADVVSRSKVLADDTCARDRFKREGWREQGLLVVDAEDQRLTWPERELIRHLGEKLYGRRASQEARHG